MQVAAWIIIILVIIFLLWLLRRWIRRLIFILILLVLAFFIYGIFSPSGAAKLWYNVRTFPQRMAGWMSNDSEFLDYDSYKSKISSIGDSVGNKVESLGDEIDELGDDIVGDMDVKNDLNKSDSEEEKNIAKDIEADNKEGEMDKNGKIARSFEKNISMNSIDTKSFETKTSNPQDENVLTGYSKSDLFGIINRYIEKNLDDDMDILVTVEYEDDSNDPQKIILQTQPR